jgi:hypothetical protein
MFPVVLRFKYPAPLVFYVFVNSLAVFSKDVSVLLNVVKN